MYILPRIVTKDSYMQIFQYKIIHKTLFLNARLFHMNFADSPACSLGKYVDEKKFTFFCEFPITLALWSQLKILYLHTLISAISHHTECNPRFLYVRRR